MGTSSTGLETNSMVALVFRDTSGGGPAGRCPQAHGMGQWMQQVLGGILFPSVEGGGTCQWATFPIMLTGDTATGPWPE